MKPTSHITKSVKTTHTQRPPDLESEEPIGSVDDMKEGYELEEGDMHTELSQMISSMSPEKLQMLVEMAQEKLNSNTEEVEEEVV